MVIRQLVGGLATVGALALIVIKVPTFMLDRAAKSAERCFLDHDDRDRGDPADCRSGWLAIAKRMPHTKQRALAEAASTERAILSRVQSAAASPSATPAQRKRAVEATLASAQDASDKAQDLVRLGAYAEAAALAPTPGHRYGHPQLHAALALGDLYRARAIVGSGADPDEWLGATACLLGEQKRGLEMLAAHVASTPTGYTSGRIAALYCGATAETFGGQDPTKEGDLLYASSMVARAFDPAFQAGRRGSLARWLRHETTLNPYVTLAANAIALSTGDPDPAEVLRLVTGDDGIPLDGVIAVTPWNVLRSQSYSDRGVDFVPPSWLDDAATRVEAALAKPPPKFAKEDYEGRELATLDAHAVMKRAAARLHAFAAVYALRAHRRTAARRSLEKLRALAPDSLDVAVLELALGEPKLALATIARWEAATKDAEESPSRTIAQIQRALAHAALGDHLAAYQAANASKVHTPEIDWLVLATGYLAKQSVDGIRQRPDESGDAARWAAAIAAKGKLPSSTDLEANAVLPAVLSVVGHAATVAGGDPEAFLDERYGYADTPSRTFLRARAEAARWRGDAAAAKRWDERADALEKLFVDDKAAALAGIARLW